MLGSRASKILDHPCFSNTEYRLIKWALRDYRSKFLNARGIKNGYKNDLHPDTHWFLEKHFAAFERKISGRALLKSGFLDDYLSGIKMIYENYYDLTCKDQGEQRREKQRKKELEEWAIMYEEWRKNKPYRSRKPMPEFNIPTTKEHRPGCLKSIAEHGRNAYERKIITH